MNKANLAVTVFSVALLGLACNDEGLKSQGSGTGGQTSSTASGGNLGLGGSGSGGVASGGAGGAGGSSLGAGGSAAGGIIGTGGSASGGRAGSNAGGGASGGKGGSNAGGSATGGVTGAGGATGCPTIMCPAIACLGGNVPNPDPCGCPICAPLDAGPGKDSAADACGPIACPLLLPVCQPGYQFVAPPCGCSTCVPIDAGAPDVTVCPPIACLAVECMYGTLPNPDPCGCPICAAPDAGVEKAPLACKDLDECACLATSGCSPIAESCYCPFPKCGSNGACICGGGKFIGCAPTGLTACSDAKARVAALCPTLKGPTFDGLCSQTNSACVTKCLDEVTACGDVFCSFCEGCDCAGDRFSTCLASCTSTM